MSTALYLDPWLHNAQVGAKLLFLSFFGKAKSCPAGVGRPASFAKSKISLAV